MTEPQLSRNRRTARNRQKVRYRRRRRQNATHQIELSQLLPQNLDFDFTPSPNEPADDRAAPAVVLMPVSSPPSDSPQLCMKAPEDPTVEERQEQAEGDQPNDFTTANTLPHTQQVLLF